MRTDDPSYDEYDRLAEWSEAGATVDNCSTEMRIRPIGWGLAVSVALGVAMYWIVRLVAWVVTRGWF